MQRLRFKEHSTECSLSLQGDFQVSKGTDANLGSGAVGQPRPHLVGRPHPHKLSQVLGTLLSPGSSNWQDTPNP